MGGISIQHWLLVLLVVVLIFGTKKLRNIGSDLGSAVKGFKDGMKGNDETAKTAEQTQQVTQQTAQNQTAAKDPNTVDVNSKDVR